MRKTQPSVTLIVLIGAIVCFLTWTRTGSATAKPSWEYKTFNMSNGIDELNKLGADGWEVVVLQPQSLSYGPTVSVLGKTKYEPFVQSPSHAAELILKRAR